MSLSPEISFIEGADAFRTVEGSIILAEMAWPDGPSGVKEQGTCTGGPPGTWETPSSPIQDTGRKGAPVTNSSRSAHRSCPGGVWRKFRTKDRYRQAKETKCGGMGVGESELPILLLTPGNQSHGTRSRKGAAVLRNRRRAR